MYPSSLSPFADVEQDGIKSGMKSGMKLGKEKAGGKVKEIAKKVKEKDDLKRSRQSDTVEVSTSPRVEYSTSPRVEHATSPRVDVASSPRDDSSAGEGDGTPTSPTGSPGVEAKGSDESDAAVVPLATSPSALAGWAPARSSPARSLARSHDAESLSRAAKTVSKKLSNLARRTPEDVSRHREGTPSRSRPMMLSRRFSQRAVGLEEDDRPGSPPHAEKDSS